MSRRRRIHNYLYEEFDTTLLADFDAFTALFASNASLVAYDLGHQIHDTATGSTYAIASVGGVKVWSSVGGACLRVVAFGTAFDAHSMVQMEGVVPLRVIAPAAAGDLVAGVLLGVVNPGEVGYLQTVGNAWIRLAGAAITTGIAIASDATATGGRAQDAVATDVSIAMPLINIITTGAIDYTLACVSGVRVI